MYFLSSKLADKISKEPHDTQMKIFELMMFTLLVTICVGGVMALVSGLFPATLYYLPFLHNKGEAYAMVLIGFLDQIALIILPITAICLGLFLIIRKIIRLYKQGYRAVAHLMPIYLILLTFIVGVTFMMLRDLLSYDAIVGYQADMRQIEENNYATMDVQLKDNAEVVPFIRSYLDPVLDATALYANPINKTLSRNRAYDPKRFYIPWGESFDDTDIQYLSNSDMLKGLQTATCLRLYYTQYSQILISYEVISLEDAQDVGPMDGQHIAEIP